MGTQKGRLFELAKMYHSYQKKKTTDRKNRKQRGKAVEIDGGHFDEGQSISLAYSMEMYPEVLYDSHKRQEAAQMSFWENDRSEAFYVEPFEVEESVAISHFEALSENEINEDRIERIVTGFSKEEEEEEEYEHEDLQKDEEKLAEMDKKLDKMFAPEDESEAMEADTTITATQNDDLEPSPQKTETDTNESTPAMKESGAPQAYEVSDEEFARDIGAILQGQKVYDAQQKKAVSRNEENLPAKTGSASKPSASGDDLMDPNKNEHKIFEKIAQSMTYANSYDLGSIALEEKFELMDREIEKEEVNKILRKHAAAQEDMPDKIEDAHVLEEEEKEETDLNEKGKAVAKDIGRYDPNVPLDETNGGRMIEIGDLQIGDLVLALSTGNEFGVLNSQGAQSIAGVYIGSDKILTKGDGNILSEKPLRPHLTTKGTLVALRHGNITTQKAKAIVDELSITRIGPEKHQPERWSTVNLPTVRLHEDVCNADQVTDKGKCLAYSGKIKLGTLTNDAFLCAESVITSYEQNQLGFVQPLTKDHNGSLKYIGHLKT
jgi:hypothetical protein